MMLSDSARPSLWLIAGAMLLPELALATAPALPSPQGWTYGPTVPTPGNAARSGATLVHAAAGTYLVGGLPASAGNGPVHALIGGAWSSTTPVEGVFLNGGVAVDSLGRVLVIAGADSGGDPGDSYVWDVANGGAGGIGERSDLAPIEGFAIAYDDSGRVLSLGGSSATSFTVADPAGIVERYDPALDEWAVRPPMPAPTTDAAACNDGLGHVLVLGGYDANGARSANVAQLDLATGGWSDTAVPDLPAPRAGAEAVLGHDGLVYLIGGSDAMGSLDSVLILDPISGTWSQGPSLLEPREHFGCDLNPDGNIWVVGGENSTTSETLFTSTCPTVVAVESSRGYIGLVTSARIVLGGSPPFTFTWRRDGVPLMDGPSGTGSTVAGTQGDTLVLRDVTAADGTYLYDCIVSNACGSTATTAIDLQLRDARELPQHMVVTSLHPAGATASAASSVDGLQGSGVVVGTTSYVHSQYGTLGRPAMWSGFSPQDHVDLTPSNSVGGACSMIRGGRIVGWWWWPYTVPHQGTGYHQHASLWEAASGTHHEMQIQGWEFGSISATDGEVHAGTCRFDESSTNSTGYRWTGTSRAGHGLTPTGAWGSGASVVDDGHIYGSVHIGFGVVHAARWDDAGATFIDLHPSASAGRSYVRAASDGVQIGQVYFGNTPASCYWAGTAESYTPVTQAGIAFTTTRHGLILGTASAGGTAVPTLFRRGVGQSLALDGFLPAGYSNSTARDLWIDPATNELVIVGSAQNVGAGRTEAIVWRQDSGGGPGTIGPGGRTPTTPIRHAQR